MKVLVTGPTGLLGNNLVRELLNDGRFEVHAFVHSNRSKKKLEGLPVEIVIGDILDKDRVQEAISGMDVVFHCAASTKIYPPKDPKIYDVNINGTNNIVEGCLKHNTHRLIYVGTANSFGFSESSSEVRNEASPSNSRVIGMGYMDSKLEAQHLVLKAIHEKSLNAVIMNPTAMLGAYDHLPSSGQIVLAMYQGKVPGYTVGGKNFIAVRDVCRAMISAIEKGRIGECYILGNQNTSYYDFFNMISKELGIKAPSFRFPNWLVIFYGTLNSFVGRLFGFKPTVTREIAITGTKYFYYDNSKAKNELGVEFTPVEDAIHECYEWFKQEKYL